jgi:hypothetical protein
MTGSYGSIPDGDLWQLHACLVIVCLSIHTMSYSLVGGYRLTHVGK